MADTSRVDRAILLVLVLLIPILASLPLAGATANSALRYHDGSKDSTITVTQGVIWTNLAVRYTSPAERTITAIKVWYATPLAFKAKFLLVNGTDTVTFLTTLKPQGNMTESLIPILGPAFLVSPGNFEIQIVPDDTEQGDLEIGLDGSRSGHSYVRSDQNPTAWEPLPGAEVMLDAYVEQVPVLPTTGVKTNGDAALGDPADIYRLTLNGTRTYVFELNNPSRVTVSLRLFYDVPATTNQFRVQEISGSGPSQRMALVPPKDDSYLLIIEYPGVTGAVAYDVKVRVNRPPVASAGPDILAGFGENVAFDAVNSSDPDSDPLTYLWEFDSRLENHDPSTKVRETRKMTRTGTFTVTLTVSDGLENVKDTVTVFVGQRPAFKISNELVDSGKKLSLGVEYTFRVVWTVAPPNTSGVIQYTWDFDDGPAPETTDSHVLAHTYLFPPIFNDAFNISVHATDTSGLDVRANAFARVNSAPTVSVPVGDLIRETKVGEAITFNSTVIDGDGFIVSVTWDFDGDGKVDQTTKTGTVNYTYTTEGVYLVNMTAKDNDGGIDNASWLVTVSKKPGTRPGPGPDGGLLALAGLILLPFIVIAIVVVVIVIFVRRRRRPYGAYGPMPGQVAQQMPPGGAGPYGGQPGYGQQGAAQEPVYAAPTYQSPVLANLGRPMDRPPAPPPRPAPPPYIPPPTGPLTTALPPSKTEPQAPPPSPVAPDVPVVRAIASPAAEGGGRPSGPVFQSGPGPAFAAGPMMKDIKCVSCSQAYSAQLSEGQTKSMCPFCNEFNTI